MNLLVVIVVLACLAGSVSLEGIRYDDDTNNHVRQTRGSESFWSSWFRSDPRLRFQPTPSKSGSSLVWFEAFDENNIKYWIDTLVEFLTPYTEINKEDERQRRDCDIDNPPMDGKVCRVDVTNQFGMCAREHDFGYSRSSPCIFLKLDTDVDWTPEFYNRSHDLPEIMPYDLQSNIAYFEKHDKRKDVIWISCEGETAADVENIGPINYMPQRGFPGYFYPFKNQKGYQQPLVAINFERPKTGVLINIECKAWARNINKNRDVGSVSVHFQLMID